MCENNHCRRRRTVPIEHLCRWVCLCGNLLKEEPQIQGLPPATYHTVGTCCAESLPLHSQHLAMPLPDGDPRSHSQDQRTLPRDLDH